MAATATESSCYRFKPADAEFADLINAERSGRGAAALELDPELSKVARVHTREMVRLDSLEHQTGDVLAARVTRWSALGENIGVGQSGVQDLHALFMSSVPHRANVLSRSFAHLGVGAVMSGERLWVTVIFEGKSDPGTTLRMPTC